VIEKDRGGMAMNKSKVKYWLILIAAAAAMSIGVADLYVNLPEQWADFVRFWF
jgi:hypothetical protein